MELNAIIRLSPIAYITVLQEKLMRTYICFISSAITSGLQNSRYLSLHNNIGKKNHFGFLRINYVNIIVRNYITEREKYFILLRGKASTLDLCTRLVVCMLYIRLILYCILVHVLAHVF